MFIILGATIVKVNIAHALDKWQATSYEIIKQGYIVLVHSSF
jgi:hypothetical protein